MKLVKIWIILGIFCIAVALVLFCYENFIGGDPWNWRWLRYESGVSIAASVGLALLVVVAAEHWWKR